MTIKTNIIESRTTNGDLTIRGDGTGVPDIEAGFKVGGAAGVPVSALRAGTDGELVTWDASGDPATVAVGTSTHVLTSNGAGAAPTFQAAGGGGAWNLIGTAETSGSSSTLSISGLSSTYDTYAIAVTDFRGSTANPPLWMRVGDSGGIDTGSTDYRYHVQDARTTGTAYGTAYASNATDKMEIASAAGVGGDAGEGYGCMIYLHRPGDAATWPRFSGTYCYDNLSASGVVGGGVFFGVRTAVIALTEIQVFFNGANISTGRLTVWGIAHA